MSQIDWSKAPEWATVRLQSVYKPEVFCWAESHTEDVRFVRDDFAPVVCQTLQADAWEFIGERPAPQWTGTGLPPVGAVCEMTHEHWGNRGWERVTVNYISSEYAITTQGHGEQHWHMRNIRFRPIRTPEQIAADEREAAIDEMTAGLSNDTLRSWAIYVYDELCYRKGDAK